MGLLLPPTYLKTRLWYGKRRFKKHHLFIGNSHVQYICSCFCGKIFCYQESAKFSFNNTLLPSVTFLRSLSNVHAFLFSFLTCTFTFSFSLFHFSLVLSLFSFFQHRGCLPQESNAASIFSCSKAPKANFDF